MKSTNEKQPCPRCGREIDSVAKICPYCGADTSSGSLVDEEESRFARMALRPEKEVDSALSTFYRDNQQLILIVALLLFIGGLLGITAFMSGSDERQVTAVPLTELTALPEESDPEGEMMEMPEPNYSVPGDPSTFEEFLTEQGEVAPEPDSKPEEQAGTATGPSSPPTADQSSNDS